MNNIAPPVGARDGNWTWDGTRWVCQPDCDFDDQPCPPFSVLQPGGRHHSPFFPPPVTQPPWYPGANGGVSFAPPGQPPPNPIRGAFWWDGTSLWLFDGAAWDVVGAGSGNVITPPGTTFPPNPAPGEQFFDGKTLWIWDGTSWVPVSQTKTYIQATAPPHPNPGDLWFDGTQLHIWTGSAWALVGPGATVGPVPTTQEAFAMVQPNTLTVGAGFTVVPFTATPQIDVFAGWDPTTKKYTPNKAGVYICYGQQYYGGTETSAGWAIAKNDTGTYNPNATITVASAGIATAPATVSQVMSSSGAVKMNGTTDYLRMYANSTDGNFYIPNSNVPVFSAWIFP